MNVNDDEDAHSRSLRSDQRCYIRFINLTERTVEITWVNFTGEYVRYQILAKGNFVDVNTFKTHPWIAKDLVTKDNLHVDKKFVYLPKTTKEVLMERFPGKHIPENYETRVRVYITLPLYSLRYLTLLYIRNTIPSAAAVDELDLPSTLAEELRKVITKKNREVYVPLII